MHIYMLLHIWPCPAVGLRILTVLSWIRTLRHSVLPIMVLWVFSIFLSLSSHLLVILLNISKTPIAFLTGYETTGLTEYIKWKLVRINKIAVWNDVIWTSIKGQMCIGNPSNITIHKPLTINSFHLLSNAFLFVSDYVHTNMKFHWGLHYTVFTKFSCR